MTIRNYKSTVKPQSLASGITSTATSMQLSTSGTIDPTTTLPTSYPYTLVIDVDLDTEEIVTVTEKIGAAYTITRGQDGTSGVAHSAGAVVKHMVTARDLQEPQNHINATSGVHGITGSFVGSSDTQTLTNKTISGTANTLTNIAQSSVSGLVDDLALKATAANPTFTGTITMPSGSITSTMLADLNVNTADIADAAITTVKINDSAITSAKIADDTIVNGDINSTANIAWSKLAADTNNIFTNPIGMISPFAGGTAPTGWLMCNGQAVSRTAYSALFSLIGTTYGAGDNTTTFNIPDLMGRTPIGVGSGTGLSTRLLGDKVGAETLPAHIHTIDHDHASATTNTEPNHVHTYSERLSNTGDSTSTAPAWDSSSDTVDGGTFYAGNPAGAHSHTLDLPNYTGNSGSTGTGNHGVMQPSLALNYIIKY